MNLLDVAQGSDEWKRARCGSLGASCVHEVVAKTKSGWSASRANRMSTIIIERLTSEPQDTYQNAAMLHGIETEPEARSAYNFYRDVIAQEVGLVRHPTIAGTHASPDGLVGDDGCLEIKCPQPAQHLSTLLGEEIPQKYIIQMQWQLRCCERQWCDFVSYNPAFPEEMRLHVQRIVRDEKLIGELEHEVEIFLSEIDAKVKTLTDKYQVAEAA